MAGTAPSPPLHEPCIHNSKSAPSLPKEPLSVKLVDPVDDYWVTASNCKMKAHTLLINAEKLNKLMKEILNPSQSIRISEFEVVSAIIWKSLSKIRVDLGPKIVTICTNSTTGEEDEAPHNGMVFSIVESDILVPKADVSDLAVMVAERTVKENEAIEDFVERDDGEGDYIVYGANLTFVNLEELNVYRLELKGEKPVFVNYSIGGVGEEGVVLVLPGPEGGVAEGGGGRVVTFVLPENQAAELKNVLQRDWGIV